jgi:hypothetical protein
MSSATWLADTTENAQAIFRPLNGAASTKAMWSSYEASAQLYTGMRASVNLLTITNQQEGNSQQEEQTLPNRKKRYVMLDNAEDQCN